MGLELSSTWALLHTGNIISLSIHENPGFFFFFPSSQLQTLSVWPFSVPLNGDVFNLLTSSKTGSSILLETYRMACKSHCVCGPL